MLPTFVIGLREGLEASLIVGIVAAFLRRNGRARDLWKMWTGVGIGVLLCTIVAVVLREGLETAVFLLALLQSSNNTATTVLGAALGIAASILIGWGIYRGGVKINIGRFFRVTGIVLVAAGLMATAAHTAHEAGWL